MESDNFNNTDVYRNIRTSSTYTRTTTKTHTHMNAYTHLLLYQNTLFLLLNKQNASTSCTYGKRLADLVTLKTPFIPDWNYQVNTS